MYNKIEADKLYDLKGPLIDIRDKREYEIDHIPNSINIPMDLLSNCPESFLKKSIKYYIYCEKGIRSTELCRELEKKGYYVVEIIGGYEKWLALRKRF